MAVLSLLLHGQTARLLPAHFLREAALLVGFPATRALLTAASASGVLTVFNYFLGITASLLHDDIQLKMSKTIIHLIFA